MSIAMFLSDRYKMMKNVNFEIKIMIHVLTIVNFVTSSFDKIRSFALLMLCHTRQFYLSFLLKVSLSC
jgi:hypothetical protein